MEAKADDEEEEVPSSGRLVVPPYSTNGLEILECVVILTGEPE